MYIHSCLLYMYTCYMKFWPIVQCNPDKVIMIAHQMSGISFAKDQEQFTNHAHQRAEVTSTQKSHILPSRTHWVSGSPMNNIKVGGQQTVKVEYRPNLAILWSSWVSSHFPQNLSGLTLHWYILDGGPYTQHQSSHTNLWSCCATFLAINQWTGADYHSSPVKACCPPGPGVLGLTK